MAPLIKGACCVTSLVLYSQVLNMSQECDYREYSADEISGDGCKQTVSRTLAVKFEGSMVHGLTPFSPMRQTYCTGEPGREALKRLP